MMSTENEGTGQGAGRPAHPLSPELTAALSNVLRTVRQAIVGMVAVTATKTAELADLKAQGRILCDKGVALLVILGFGVDEAKAEVKKWLDTTESR